MASDDRTAQQHLTPEERRTYLRAFADRMLIKVTAMDDPEDMPGIERAVRVASVIERLYSRCDRSEGQAPDPGKIEAERARNQVEAIQARAKLAGTLEWGEKRQKDLGKWWDAAKESVQPQIEAVTRVTAPVQAAVQPQVAAAPQDSPEKAVSPYAAALRASTGMAVVDGAVAAVAPPHSQTPVIPGVRYIDYIETLRKAHAGPGLEGLPKTGLAEPEKEPPPPRP